MLVPRCDLKNFPNITEKLLCWSLSFNKDAGWRPVSLLKKKLKHNCFLVNFEKHFKNYFIDYFGRLLLKILQSFLVSNLWGDGQISISTLNLCNQPFSVQSFQVEVVINWQVFFRDTSSLYQQVCRKPLPRS